MIWNLTNQNLTKVLKVSLQVQHHANISIKKNWLSKSYEFSMIKFVCCTVVFKILYKIHLIVIFCYWSNNYTKTESHVFHILLKHPFLSYTPNMAAYAILRHTVTILVTDFHYHDYLVKNQEDHLFRCFAHMCSELMYLVILPLLLVNC